MNDLIYCALMAVHWSKGKLCSSEGCTNVALKGGVCMRHGAKLKLCSSEGCTNVALKWGVCIRHGAKVKLCSIQGCINRRVRNGVCRRHGAYRNPLDESTVLFGSLGSQFDMTTATLPPWSSGAAVRGQQGGSSVPEEVTVICEEIVEVWKLKTLVQGMKDN